MRTEIQWQDIIPTPPEDSNYSNCVWAVCFRPDGAEVLVAVADRIFIYDPSNGELIKQIRGHRDSVYCIAYSKDGQKFATGGADNSVVIWSNTGEGLLKYSHNDKIQCLAFNPVLQNLASCTSIDFGLWQSDQANVNKQKIPSKCVACDWSPDGQLLALGFFSGRVQVRDKTGAELFVIERGTQPAWSVAFCPQKFETSDNLLVIGTWDQKLGIFSISGGKNYKQLGSDKDLGFDPCSISFYPTGEYMVLSGSDKKITLWNKEGVLLGTIGEMQDWVWSTAINPINKSVFAGANNGAIALHSVEFNTIHGLYQDRYAYRELMTDVIIQHLVTETRVKIRCRDYIKKIAIYKDRLAVQLPEKIIIYSVSGDDPYDMKYKAYKKINKKIDCNLLFVLSQHLVLVFEKKIQLLSFSGILEREWVLDSVIRYVKTISGPPKQESLLVGLKNGSISKIFIDNAFAIPIVKQTTSIRVVDISADKQKIAIVDDHNSMFVYDIKSQQLLFQETNIYSVAWNLEMEDMLSYTGKDTLYIKTREMPPSEQRLPGYVVGFKGSKIFCLHSTTMNTIDVPQSSTFYRFLEKKDYQMAYKIACLGVTEQDWRALGIEALLAKNFSLAKKAFVRIRDLKFIDLTDKSEHQAKMKTLNDLQLTGDILAYQGKYKEAASHFCKNNLAEKAINLYTTLKNFTVAKELTVKYGARGGANALSPEVLIDQAMHEYDCGNWKAAADLYQSAGKYKEAIDIYGKRGQLDPIMDICRNLDQAKNKADIELCAKYFKQHGHHTFAKQALLRLGDLKGLMGLHVELHKWDEAFMLAKQNPQLEPMIYLPYADWLSANDRFDEAQEAYKKASRPDLSLRIVEFLTFNAVTEKRFQDAAQYYWHLSAESLKLIKDPGPNGSKEDKKYMKNFEEYMRLAEIYQAYQLIHRFIEESYQAVIQGPFYNEAIFNSARFLVNNIGKRQPLGISKVYIYYALSYLGTKFEAFKTARFGFEKLQSLKVPTAWQDDIELANLKVRAKPFSDKEGFQVICNRCMNNNSLVNANGDFCNGCGQPFVRNFVGFDTLPLVEFQPRAGIPLNKVFELLKADPPEMENGAPTQAVPKKKPAGGGADGWQENGDEQTLSFNNPADQYDDLENDLFTQRMLEWLETQVTPDSYRPVEVDEHILKAMRYEEVFIVDYSHFCPNWPKRFFKSMVPDVAITNCEKCSKFFLQDEYEFAYMEKNCCPFCKNVEEEKGIRHVMGNLSEGIKNVVGGAVKPR